VQPRTTSAAGQASVEYALLLALVAGVLGAAGVAGEPLEVGRKVVATVRAGICIVAGDICRPADAAAAGLRACELSDQRRGEGGAFTVAIVRFGANKEWLAAVRSDGTVAVTRTEDASGGVTAGVGFGGGPVKVGADAQAELAVAFAKGWEFPSVEAANAFFSAPEDRRPEPAWRSYGGGMRLEGQGGVQAGGGTMLAGLEAHSEAMLGYKRGPGRRVSGYLRIDQGIAAAAGPTGRIPLVGSAPVVIEYVEEGGPRELIVRQAARMSGGRAVETTVRLDLGDPVNLEYWRALLRLRAPWDGADLRAIVLRAAQVGIAERAVYSVDDRSRSVELSAKLGIGLGFEYDRTTVDRQLVRAEAWIRGERARQRNDCLPELI
jgi:hypothetical protein